MASRNSNDTKMCLFSRLLRWWFFVVFVSHWQKKQTIFFVSAVLETAAVDVYLEQNNDNDPSPSYTMLVSQALFGSYPKMNPENNPARAVHTPPEDNPLLCNEPSAAGDAARWKPQGTAATSSSFAMMVPRGNCTFEIKAYNAQLMGASAMILYGTLASRYSLNTTGRPPDHPYTDKSDVIYPVDKYDYDCDMGRALIPASALDMNPHGIDVPYNASYNDPKLSGDDNNFNLCMQNSPDHLSKCPSRACLLTGKVDEFDKAEACCAWDLHIWLYPDAQFELNHTTSANQSSSSSSAAATTTPGAPPLVTIPSFYVTMAQGHKLLNDLEKATASTMRVILYARWRSAYNWSSLLVWLLGVCTAAVAAYLSAHDLHALNRKLMAPRGSSSQDQGQQRSSGPRRVAVATPTSSPAEEMELTVWHALIFVVMASTSLMVLFYFKIYNAVKVGYAVGCSKAVSQVFLDPILKRVMRKCCNIRNDHVVLRTDDFGDITVRDIISHALAYAWGLAWICFAFFVLHPERYAFFWITQDVFGVAMCILFLQVIKVNCVRVAAVLLSVAFFYDIFFVFITPLLARDGKSVMITVATSGGPPAADAAWCEKYPRDPNCAGGDPLPMLLTVPRLEDYQGGASLLGLGDVVLPGLLLAFCARYDAAKRLMALLGGGGRGGGQAGTGSASSGGSTYHECPEERFLCASTVTCCSVCCCRAGYFWPVAMAYGAGLAMANVAVYVMNYGQPALLYLVPACLGTVCCLAHRRGEWTDLWRGPKILKTADKVVNGRRGRRIMMMDDQNDVDGNGEMMEEDDDDDDNEAETTTQQHDNHERIPTEDGMQAPSVPSAVRQQQQQQQYQEGAAVNMEVLEDTKR